jgi:hypothetical protein
MAEPPPELQQLTAKFEQNIESYRNPAYGEAEVRIEFINPLFELLGWDVANKEVAAAKNPNDKINLQREIEATDRQIDQLVYELYRLTEDEIKIVETP